MKAFFDMMDKDPRKVMILGGSCNSVTDSIAKTSKHWRIPVVSGEFIHFFRDTRPLLLDDDLFGCVANQSTGQGRCALTFFFPLSFIYHIRKRRDDDPFFLHPFIPYTYTIIFLVALIIIFLVFDEWPWLRIASLDQLSYADTHPMFTRKSYPNFFRIVPSENAFNAPRVKLLQAFNWTRVGTLYQNEPRFALVSYFSFFLISFPC